MEISKLSYNNIKAYNRDNFPIIKDENSYYITYRKLKEIPYYYYYDENYKGVMPVIIVRNNIGEIDLYQFNYNDVLNKGVDVVLIKKLNVFDSCQYVYAFDNYDTAIQEFLNSKLKYLNSRKDILIEQIKTVEQDRSIKMLEERERLTQELEQKLNAILDVYDSRIIYMESKLNKINKQITDTNELISYSSIKISSK